MQNSFLQFNFCIFWMWTNNKRNDLKSFPNSISGLLRNQMNASFWSRWQKMGSKTDFSHICLCFIIDKIFMLTQGWKWHQWQYWHVSISHCTWIIRRQGRIYKSKQTQPSIVKEMSNEWLNISLLYILLV